MLNIQKYKDKILNNIQDAQPIFCFIHTKLMKKTDCNNCITCKKKSIEWLCERYEEPILTDEEKIIIKDIIKAFEPFGKELKYITKYSWNIEPEVYYLNFEYNGDDFDTFNFSGDEFFVGLALDKAYTPEELGL